MFECGLPSETRSKLHLVDLAGRYCSIVLCWAIVLVVVLCCDSGGYGCMALFKEGICE